MFRWLEIFLEKNGKIPETKKTGSGLLKQETNMSRDEIDFDVIINAQGGHQESLSALTEHVRNKISVYIYRLTLDYHLTEDLTQDTIVEILKSIKRLNIENVAGFWAWTYRTALSKVQHHFRLQGSQRIRKQTLLDNDFVDRVVSGHEIHGPEHLMRREMVAAVFDAMGTLKLEHRSILALRCMNELSYAQIARIIGGSELRARLLFIRARQSLKRQLSKRNFEKKYLLTALGMFSYITAKSTNAAQASSLISSATLSVGAKATVAGLATSKPGAVCILIVVIAVIFSFNSRLSNVPPPQPSMQTPLWDGNLGMQSWSPSVTGPSAVVDSNDPDSSGWQSVDASLPDAPVLDTTPEEVLLNRKTPVQTLILPKGHWVELQFDGPVYDGDGADIFVLGKTDGEPPEVYLANSSGQRLKISPTSYQGIDFGGRYFGFDIAGYDIPSEADRVRVVGVDSAPPYGGYALHHVRARTKPLIENNLE